MEIQMRAISVIKSVILAALGSLAVVGLSNAQQEYGQTDFEASGSRAAHAEFTRGLLQLHNFEYEDARASFQSALEIDSDFTMAYWGEALSYEHSFWGRFDTDASKAALTRLGSTAVERASKAKTAREKAYLNTVEILFSEGTQEEREIRYSEALRDLHEQYPDDLDAAAFYALSILVTTYGGRDYARYMQAGAITEEILDKNPLHPGALHYGIHSYDDPTHAPLGLRAARDYFQVAPAAIHALHMGSHIYYALGMWEEGVDRNTRSFEEAVSRQADPDDPYGGQTYHALTWIPYGLQQWGKRKEARDYIAMIEKQADRYPSATVHRRHLVTTRASYVVDTGEWDSELAAMEIDLTGLDPYAVATDHYLQGLVALNHDDLSGARASLAVMGGANRPMDGNRSTVSPHLLRLALEGQIEVAAGNADAGLELIAEAEALEATLPSEYGPAVPIQPMAELLADTYLALGNHQMARQYYDDSLARAVGRERSLVGLEKARAAASASEAPTRGEPMAGVAQ
jgi:tetratricopeptide (TPR) repeat protein